MLQNSTCPNFFKCAKKERFHDAYRSGTKIFMTENDGKKHFKFSTNTELSESNTAFRWSCN